MNHSKNLHRRRLSIQKEISTRRLEELHIWKNQHQSFVPKPQESPISVDISWKNKLSRALRAKEWDDIPMAFFIDEQVQESPSRVLGVSEDDDENLYEDSVCELFWSCCVVLPTSLFFE